MKRKGLKKPFTYQNPLIIPFFIPHAGCPFTCVFCNQWQISGTAEVVRPDEIDAYVAAYLKRARLHQDRHVEIAFYGGSFTALAPEIQTAYLQAAAEQQKKGRICGIRLSTRPDFINRAIVERLLAYGVTTVELGVQSLVDEVLQKTGRGHTAQDTLLAVELLREYPLQLGLQLMLGLPGDTPDRARLTLERAVQAAPDFVRIYPTLVFKGTTLAQWYLAKQYRPWSLDLAVDTAAAWLGTFSYYEIPVIRIGLQAAENFTKEQDLLAGPYHPAFGELVASRLFLWQIEDGLKRLRKGAEASENKGAGGPVREDTGKKRRRAPGESRGDEEGERGVLQLLVHPSVQSKVIGQKRQNIMFLREKYGYNVVVLPRSQKYRRSDEEIWEGGSATRSGEKPEAGKDGENEVEDIEIRTISQAILIPRKEFLKKYRIEIKDATLGERNEEAGVSEATGDPRV